MTSVLIPNQLDSDQQYNRFHHHDLAHMETEDLLDEFYFLRSRLWLFKADLFTRRFRLFEQSRKIQWARERTARIEAELRRRRYELREARSQPKPKLPKVVS